MDFNYHVQGPPASKFGYYVLTSTAVPNTTTANTAGGNTVADTNTSANTSANGNASTGPTGARPQSRHICGIDGCTFSSATAKGIREHQKNKHLGTQCYWVNPDGEFCDYTALTHEALYDHFNREHLRPIQQAGPPYQCCWPGNPGIPIPNGSAVPPENPCEQTFQHMSSAHRHAREHQHRIWRAMDSVVWPVARDN